MSLEKYQVNNTLKAFWISSGTSPSVVTFSVISGSETIVSSGSGVNSGNGHFYRFFQVNTVGYYVGKWNATISGLPYERRFRFKGVIGEVD